MVWKIAVITLVVGFIIAGCLTPSRATAQQKQRFVRISNSQLDNSTNVEVIKDTVGGGCFVVYVTTARYQIRLPSVVASGAC